MFVFHFWHFDMIRAMKADKYQWKLAKFLVNIFNTRQCDKQLKNANIFSWIELIKMSWKLFQLYNVLNLSYIYINVYWNTFDNGSTVMVSKLKIINNDLNMNLRYVINDLSCVILFYGSLCKRLIKKSRKSLDFYELSQYFSFYL